MKALPSPLFSFSLVFENIKIRQMYVEYVFHHSSPHFDFPNDIPPIRQSTTPIFTQKKRFTLHTYTPLLYQVTSCAKFASWEVGFLFLCSPSWLFSTSRRGDGSKSLLNQLLTSNGSAYSKDL